MIATFNPCGFAMLPAYLGLFLGNEVGASSGGSVRRALLVGGSVTAGFIAVFGLAGLLISAFAIQVAAWAPYLTIVIGPPLVLLGIWLLMGGELSVRLPRFHRAVGDGPGGMFVYGIIYATVSLSCTIPVFLVAVVGTFSADSWLAGAAVLLAYALGMGLMLTVLALAVALARDGLLSRSRAMVQYTSRVSGVLLVVAGAYITWYGYVEIQLLSGNNIATGPVDMVARWSGTLSTLVSRFGGPTLAVVGVAVLGIVAFIGWITQRRRNHRNRGPTALVEQSQIPH
ncbi:MAG: cytochrome c biogenesis CcdA family protein [Candidatus Nanopelagicales bacterium]